MRRARIDHQRGGIAPDRRARPPGRPVDDRLNSVRPRGLSQHDSQASRNRPLQRWTTGRTRTWGPGAHRSHGTTFDSLEPVMVGSWNCPRKRNSWGSLSFVSNLDTEPDGRVEG